MTSVLHTRFQTFHDATQQAKHDMLAVRFDEKASFRVLGRRLSRGRDGEQITDTDLNRGMDVQLGLLDFHEAIVTRDKRNDHWTELGQADTDVARTDKRPS
jgi:hypothetical protein